MADMIKQFLPKGGSDAVDQLSEMLAEALGLPIDSAAWIVIAGVSLVTLLFAVFLFRTLFGSGEKKAKRGTDLVLLGHCNAGKTCLFYQLKAQTFPETVSSLEVKEEEFPLQGLKKEAVVKVVDFPGHARLRGELPKYLKSARGILFLVDATAASSQSVMRETADLLYDILTGCIRARNEPKVMVICNKHDDSKAASSEVIKAALEKEMNVLKKTRHSLEVEGEDGEQIILGTDGVDFDFENDAGCEVDFCEGSVKDGDLEPMFDFVDELYD